MTASQEPKKEHEYRLIQGKCEEQEKKALTHKPKIVARKHPPDVYGGKLTAFVVEQDDQETLLPRISKKKK